MGVASHPPRRRRRSRGFGFVAFSTASEPSLNAISIPHDGKEEYMNMWQKVRSIWRFVHRRVGNG